MHGKYTPRRTFGLILVDDEALVREGLIRLFESVPELSIVAGGHDHESAYAALPGGYSLERRTVALLDLTGCGGPADVVRYWRHRLPRVGIVLLDDGVRDFHLRHALRLRTSYATKRDHFEDVAEVVLRTAATEEQAFSPQARRRLSQGPRGWELRAPSGAPGIHFLTPRETEVLVHLAEGHSIQRCSELLNISTSTVDNHKSRIMKKLKMHKIVELVRFAMREGLVAR